MSDFVQWYVVCIGTGLLNKASYGVVEADQVLTGYSEHKHRLRSEILADLERGVGYATAQVTPESDARRLGGFQVIPGARIHRVRAAKGPGEWISTDPNETTGDNLGNLPWCDQVIVKT
jgi:hypothetical protein